MTKIEIRGSNGQFVVGKVDSTYTLDEIMAFVKKICENVGFIPDKVKITRRNK